MNVRMKPEGNSILPSPDILNNLEYGKFVLSNLAAKRAKQIKDGAPPLVRLESNHPLSIALAEIAQGKIRPTFDSDVNAIVDNAADSLESTTPELGILLPALEDSEIEVFGILADEHDDHDGDLDLSDASITDLLDDAEVDELDTVEDADADTLSLSDIAEEEAAEESDENQE